MANKKRGREFASCDLFNLAGELPASSRIAGDPASAVLAEDGSVSPLRTAIQRGSGQAWIADAHTQFVDQGLEADEATGLLVSLVNAPSLAVRDERRIRQALVIGGRDMAVYAQLDATVVPGTPPQLTSVVSVLLPVDLDDAGAVPVDHLVELAGLLELTYREFKVRETTARPGSPQEMLVLGTPGSAYRDVPPDWEAQLRLSAAVLGLRLTVARTPTELHSQDRLSNADAIVHIGDRGGWNAALDELGEAERAVTVIGRNGEPFDDFHHEFRRQVTDILWQSRVQDPSSLPTVKPGETIYHRKVMNGRKFDLFDAGSSKACKHGAGALIRFDGDKAVKGMARRYANFETSMLWHCRHYPNCGMYAVKA